MQKRPLPVNDIGGYAPLSHPALADSPRVLSGKNYRWVAGKLTSGWGNDFVGEPLPQEVLGDNYLGCFSVGITACVLTQIGVYGQDASGSWSLILPLNDSATAPTELMDYPWSMAFVGDTYFFCHPSVGLVSYQYPTDTWEFVGEIPSIAGPYFSITEASNRLLILAGDTISWSEPDEGLEVTASVICGGNFISSSIAEYGKPIGLASLGDGAIMWTTKGTVVLEPFAPNATQANALSMLGFRATRQRNAPTPINPYAFTHGPTGSVYLLTKTGLAITNGGTTEQVSPELGLYLAKVEIPRLASLHNQHSIRLHYAQETGELFISTIHRNPRFASTNLYAQAYVLETASGKWGQFTQPHRLICPVNFASGSHYDHMLGFIGGDYFAHWFNHATHNSAGGVILPIDSTANIGPISLTENTEVYYVETQLRHLRLFVENRRLSFNPYESDERSPISIQAEYGAEVYTYSGKGLNPMNLTLENRRQARGDGKPADNIQTYSCAGTGLYHILQLQTPETTTDAYYALSGFNVELGIANLIG